MHSFSMRPAKYFYDEPLPKYLDPKTVLIYRPHPVVQFSSAKRKGGGSYPPILFKTKLCYAFHDLRHSDLQFYKYFMSQ